MATDPGEPRADGNWAPGTHAQQVRHLIEFDQDGYVETDATGLIQASNQAASLLLKCSKEFLIGKPLGLFLNDGYRAEFYKCLARLHEGCIEDGFEGVVRRRGVESRVVFRVASIAHEGGEAAFRWTLRDVTHQRRVEAARNDLVLQLVTAQEDERKRIARELHDTVGQLLTALLLNVRAVRDAGPIPDRARERLDEVQRLADEIGQATHDLAVGLRPTALDDLGLYPALKNYLETWSARTGVASQLQAIGSESGRYPAVVETTLYRIVQEALTNIARHAEARMVSLIVEFRSDQAIAIIEDDGRGFDTRAVAESGRLGILGMQERAAVVGGRLYVESSVGSGTTVVARIPLHPYP
ncbi:MAG: histidine kinase [Isosphaeraceae bacterium]